MILKYLLILFVFFIESFQYFGMHHFYSFQTKQMSEISV